MTYSERIFDAETNKTNERPYTDAEKAEVEAAQSVALTKSVEQAQAATDKAALLAKLGITADEAKLLLS